MCCSCLEPSRAHSHSLFNLVAWGLPKTPKLEPLQAADPAAKPAPFLDLSHRQAAWQLGQGVNVTLSDLTLLGLCSMVMEGSQGSGGTSVSAKAPAQPVVPTALPDQLLVTAGLEAQGRVLSMAAPVWAMQAKPDLGYGASISVGPANNITLLAAVQKRGALGGDAQPPPGHATVVNATLVVPTAELLLYHYLSAWVDAVPSLTGSQASSPSSNSSSTTTISIAEGALASGQHLLTGTLAGLQSLLGVMLPERKVLGTSPAIRVYSPTPRVVHIAQWAALPSGNSIQVGHLGWLGCLGAAAHDVCKHGPLTWAPGIGKQLLSLAITNPLCRMPS